MISACLMGTRCRYDGGAYDSMVLQNRLEKCTLIPVCPEQLGGCPPRAVLLKEWGSVCETVRAPM